MTAKIVKTVRPKEVVYNGRPALVTEHRLGSSPLGLRIVDQKWLDTEIHVIRLIRGDGRKATFEEFGEKIVEESGVESAIEQFLHAADLLDASPQGI